jgi:hypothetical protein
MQLSMKNKYEICMAQPRTTRRNGGKGVSEYSQKGKIKADLVEVVASNGHVKNNLLRKKQPTLDRQDLDGLGYEIAAHPCCCGLTASAKHLLLGDHSRMRN